MTQRANRQRRRRVAGWMLLGLCVPTAILWLMPVTNVSVGPGGLGWCAVEKGSIRIAVGSEAEVVESWVSMFKPGFEVGEPLPEGEIPWTFSPRAQGVRAARAAVVMLPLWPLVLSLWLGGLVCLVKPGPGRARLLWGASIAALGGVVLLGATLASGRGACAVNLAPLWLRVSHGSLFPWWQHGNKAWWAWMDQQHDQLQPNGRADIVRLGDSTWGLWEWGFGLGYVSRSYQPRIPALVLVGASAAGGSFLLWSGWRTRQRHRNGACLRCGYDLGGLSGGVVCPECGEQVVRKTNPDAT